MVDRAALEMPCPLPDPGFESLTLRQKQATNSLACFFITGRDSNPKGHRRQQRFPVEVFVGDGASRLNEPAPHGGLLAVRENP